MTRPKYTCVKHDQGIHGLYCPDARPPEWKHDCDCRIETDGSAEIGFASSIAYCPMHLAAPKLVAALEDVSNFGADDSRLRDRIRALLREAAK